MDGRRRVRKQPRGGVPWITSLLGCAEARADMARNVNKGRGVDFSGVFEESACTEAGRREKVCSAL